MTDPIASAGVWLSAGRTGQRHPMRHSAGHAGPTGPPVTFDSSQDLLSLQFIAPSQPREAPRAVLSAHLPDKTLQFEYPVSGSTRDTMQRALTTIRQRYEQQVSPSELMEPLSDTAESGRDAQKSPLGSLLDQMNKLLGFQEMLEVVVTFEEVMGHDDWRAKQQQLLRDEISDWYGGELGLMRHQLRNHRSGLAARATAPDAGRDRLHDAAGRASADSAGRQEAGEPLPPGAHRHPRSSARLVPRR